MNDNLLEKFREKGLKFEVHDDVCVSLEKFDIRLRCSTNGHIEINVIIGDFSFTDTVTAKVSRKINFRDEEGKPGRTVLPTYIPVVKVANRAPRAKLNNIESIDAMMTQGQALIAVTLLVKELVDHHDGLALFFCNYDKSFKERYSNTAKNQMVVSDIKERRNKLSQAQANGTVTAIKKQVKEKKRTVTMILRKYDEILTVTCHQVMGIRRWQINGHKSSTQKVLLIATGAEIQSPPN